MAVFSSSLRSRAIIAPRSGGEEIIAADTKQKLNNECLVSHYKPKLAAKQNTSPLSVPVSMSKGSWKSNDNLTNVPFVFAGIGDFCCSLREIKCWAFRRSQTMQTVPPANDPCGGGGGIIGIRADRNKKMGIERGAAERDWLQPSSSFHRNASQHTISIWSRTLLHTGLWRRFAKLNILHFGKQVKYRIHTKNYTGILHFIYFIDMVNLGPFIFRRPQSRMVFEKCLLLDRWFS